MRCPSVFLFVLLVVATLMLASTSASATTAMILPVDGPGLLPTLRVAVESGVRDALIAHGGTSKKTRFLLTSREDSAAVLDDAGGAGLACSLDDAVCLVRIGVIAGVDEVFAPVAVQEGSALQLRLTRVDVITRRAVVLVVGVVVHPEQDHGESIGRLVERSLAPPATLTVDGPAGATLKVAGVLAGRLPLSAPLGLDPGTRDLQALDGGRLVARASVVVVVGSQTVTLVPLAAAPVVAVAAAPEPVSTANLFVAGAATLGGGSLLALVGGVGAAVVEVGLSTPKPGADNIDDVAAQRTLGSAFVGAAALGAVVAVVGGVLLAVDAP